MGAALATLFRTMLARTAGSAAMRSGGSAAAGTLGRQGAKTAAVQQGRRSWYKRMLGESGLAPETGAGGAKGRIDYKKLMGDMANPKAMEDAHYNAERAIGAETDARRGIIGRLEDEYPAMGKLIGVTEKLAPLWAKLTIGVGGFLFVVNRWTRSMVDSQRVLAKYNGSIATAVAQLDVQQIRLGYQKASATSGSSVMLSQAIKEFRKEFQPLSEVWGSISNTAEAAVVKLGTILTIGFKTIGGPLLSGVGLLEAWIAGNIGGGGDGNPAQNILNTVVSGQYKADKPRPPLEDLNP